MGGERSPKPRFLPERLPRLESPVVQLGSLVRFLEHPTKAFLRERLGFYAGDISNPLSDGLPVDLDALERWGVGDRLLEARLAGATHEQALAAERGRGMLPPGALEEPVLHDIVPAVKALVAAVDDLPCSGTAPAPIEVNVQLPDGRSLVGVVAGVRDGTVLRCLYSKLGRNIAWLPGPGSSRSQPHILS